MQNKRLLMYLLAGILFGLTDIKGQAIGSAPMETANVETSPYVDDNLEANNGSIGMADDGTFVIAFQQKESSGSGNYTDIKFGVSTISSVYTEIGLANTYKANIQRKPVVAVSNDGSTFAIAWQSQSSANATTYDLYVKVYGSVNGPSYSGTGDIKVNSTTISSGDIMDVAMDSNGDFVVAWSDVSTDKIYAQRFNSAGTKQGGIISVDNVYGIAVYNLSVGMDAAGEFVVTWYDTRTEDSNGGGIFAKKFNADGTVQNNSFLVNHTTSGYQNGGQVDLAPSGEFIVAYLDGTDAYYRKYEANGTVIGTYSSLSISGFSGPRVRGIAIDENLNYTIAFSENGEGIYTQRFEWDGSAIGTATTISTSADYGDLAISRHSTEYSSYIRMNQITSSPVQYSIKGYRYGLCIEDPGAITGEISVCPGQSSVSYSLSAVSGASSYNWTLSNASIATFSNGTASISTASSSVNVNFDESNTGTVTLTVEADGGAACGTSPNTSDISILNSSISNPGSISGSTSVVENTLKQYSISPISGAVNYNWILPAGATIDTDNGYSVLVQFGTTSGDISVTATDECGNETNTSSLSITVNAVDNTPPEAISMTPAHREDGVALNNNTFYIRFDETVTLVPGQTAYLKTGSGKLSTTVATASSTSNISNLGKVGWAINFPGGGTRTAGTNYFIEIPATMFRDAQSNYFAGTGSSTWSFIANRIPTDISLSNTELMDGDPSSTEVGILSATDEDANESFNYSLISGTGDDDNTLFTISDEKLLTNHAVDFETQDTYSIRVRVSDGAEATYSKALSLTVTDVDDSGPVMLSSSPSANETGIDIDSDIIVTFDENIELRDDFTTTIRLKRGTSVDKFWTYNPADGVLPDNMTISGASIILELPSDLHFNRTYTLEAFSIADELGNTNYSDEFSFTTRPASFENDILTFSIPGMVGDAIIDPVNHTVTATMEALASNVAIPTATISEGASSVLIEGNEITFVKNGSKSIGVSAESTTYQSWQIILTWETLGGDYTIGENQNFETINDFLSSLSSQGTTSDITASITDGYHHDGEIFLSTYSGNDSYTVTFKPQSGASNITFTNTSGANIVDFYTSKGFIIDGADPATGDRVFKFQSVEGVTTAVIDITAYGNGQVKNSIIEATQYGIYTSTNTNNNQSGYHFSNNEIIFKNSQNTADLAGIYVRWSRLDGCSATGNIIRMDPEAADAKSMLGILSGGSMIINNNVIIGRADNFLGIRVNVNSFPSEIRHNTVVLTGAETGTGTPGELYGIYTQKTSSSIALDIQNNLVHIGRSYSSDGWIKTGLLFYNGQTNSSADYNNLWVSDDAASTSHLLKNGAAGYKDDLAGLNTLMPNSTNVEAMFSNLANGDATISGASLSNPELRSTSFYLSTDISGSPRSTVAPSKGAHESDNIITDIFDFSIPNQKGDIVIDADSHTITAAIDEIGDITSIVPTFTIFAGASIDPNSGVSQDFTNDVTYTVTAEAGNTQNWTVSINANSAPTDISLSAASIEENNSAGDVIGTLSATDADATDTHTYSLISGDGDLDNGYFDISGDELVTTEVFDYETKSSYSVRVQVSDGNGGIYSKSFLITIIDVTNEAIVWDGSWSNEIGPSATDDVVIAATYTGSLTCNNLVVNSSVILSVTAGNTLDVHGDLTNEGSVIVESGASLLTYNGNTIKDNITIKRNTRYADGKYSFVGSPMEMDPTITGALLGNPVYAYDESVAYGTNDGLNRWESALTATLIPGQGYAQAFQQVISFTGRPNDGTINATTSLTDDVDAAYEGWNLLSNPYPAAINVTEFLTENTNINGALYIWDDNNSQTQRGSNADYLIVNGLSYTQTSQAGNQNRYNNHVGAMQGFFVKMNGTGLTTSVAFTEDMRVIGDNEDDHFYRTADEYAILRLNLTNDHGLFKQTVIGFVSGADDQQINRLYDAPVFDPKADNMIFTQKKDQFLAIQGASPQFEKILIGLNVKEAGMYVLDFNLTEFNGTTLFLHDAKLNKTIDLSDETYAFSSSAGQFLDRFSLVSTAATILKTPKQKIKVYENEKAVHITRSAQEGQALYRVLNLSGVEVARELINATGTIDLNAQPAGIYLIIGENQTHKIILN